MKSKIIALYLPQFHSIPENDEFWGKGFTDWETVKKAKPLFKGHNQPRIPLNNNYYDLSLKGNVEWQCKVAHDYGIYGFGVYHYWFNNEKNLLTKPAELMRDSSCIQTKYFFVWDNCNWKRSWSNVSGNDWSPIADSNSSKNGPQLLVPYILGSEKDWLNHYNYLRSHFLSKNYEKKDNMPVFSIINTDSRIFAMCRYWNDLAKKDGFDGIFYIFRYSKFKQLPLGSYSYNYEPHFSAWSIRNHIGRIRSFFIRKLKLEKQYYIYDYDKIYRRLIKFAEGCKDPYLYHCAFTSYDDSPRRGNKRSRVIIGESPAKFMEYFKQLLLISSRQNKDYLFLTAWNEWSEGAYVEPDSTFGYSYLEAIKKVTNE